MAEEVKAKNGLAEQLAADFASVQAWWRDAGVETGFSDQPRQWLRPIEAEPGGAASGVPRAIVAPAQSEQAKRDHPKRDDLKLGGDPVRWPRSLEEFADWWLTEPSLGLAGDGRRVTPRGPAGAELMLLVPQPERGDETHLLSGRQGKLLAAILAAIGLSEERAYVASVLPAHVGLIDWALLSTGGMGQVVAHHIGLAAPKRLLVLGREGISTLLDHDLADFGLASTHFNNPERGPRVAFAPELAGLLERPSRKAAVWRLLLDGGI